MTSTLDKKLFDIGHWEIQADTGELYWSDEIYRIHGMEVGGEVDVEAAINAYHPDDRAKVGEYVRRALEEKEDYQFELRLIRPNGDIRYVTSTGVVRLKPCGNVRSVFGIFQDITDQKKAEEEKRQSAALIDALIEHSPVPVSIKGLDGKYHYISPAFSRYLNETPEDTIGKKVGDIYSDEVSARLRAADQEVIDTGKPLDIEESFPVRLGTSTLQVTKFPVFDNNHDVVGVGTVGIDISEIINTQNELQRHRDLLEKTVDERTKELIRSEEKYRTIFDNAQVGIGRTRFSDGKILEANSKMAELLGYDDVDELISDFNFSERFVDPNGRQKLLELFKQSPVQIYETSVYCKNDSIITLSAHGRANMEEDYIDYLCVDITEKKKAEDRIKLFLENVHEGVFLVKEGKIIDVSSTGSSMLGYTHDEIIGMSPLNLVAAVHR